MSDVDKKISFDGIHWFTPCLKAPIQVISDENENVKSWKKFLETYTMSNVTFEYFRPHGQPIKTAKKTKTIDEEFADAY